MNLLAHRVKDVAVPVVAAGRPTTDMDAGTADGLLPCVADFDAASAWGDGDEVTTEIPDGAGFDPTSLGSAWGDGNGNDATTGVIAADPPGTDVDVGAAGGLLPDVVDFDPTSAWGGGDEFTATIADVPTRKRKRLEAARADDTDDGAKATGLSSDAIGTLVGAHGSATKKRRRKQSRTTVRDGQRYGQRMARLGTARGDPPGSDPTPVGGHPTEDWAEW